jgi:tetratricopeptide (TPR) repeat protein
VTLGGTADSAAQDLYLKASAIFRTTDGEEAYRQALGLSNAALARDPNYADAHVLRALVFANLADRYAKTSAEAASTHAQGAAAANRAITLAAGLGYAYAVLGLIELDSLNFAGALSHVRRAIDLSPDDPRMIGPLVNVVPYLGSPQEALRLADRAVALDPLEPRTFSARAAIFKILRRYPEAIDAARKALQLAPQLSIARIRIGDCLTLMNRPPEANAEYQKLPADDSFRLAGEAILAARSRDLAGAEKVMAHLRTVEGALASYQYAQIYAQAGDTDRAFAELGNAVEAKDPGLVELKTDPFMDPIRGDPRYAALLKQLNFP